MSDIESFFIDLAKLTEKYGYEIDGCGCCGSPYLSQAGSSYLLSESKEYEVSDIAWNDAKKKYCYTIEEK